MSSSHLDFRFQVGSCPNLEIILCLRLRPLWFVRHLTPWTQLMFHPLFNWTQQWFKCAKKNEYARQLRKFSKPYGEKLNQEGGNPRRELRKFRYTGCGACGDSSWNTPKVATLFPWFLYTAYQIIFRGRMYWVICWPYGGTLFINFTQLCICHIFAPIDKRGRAKGVKEMEGHRGY